MSSTLPKRQSLSTIESSVTRLLVATKKLLEGLTHWAKHAATENDVSDSYVNLGNEFKVACRAFSNAGVDVSDLGDVPHSLRIVLEEALCEEPSQESLDKFLPIIREIIVNLLQNLKRKQATVKQLQAQAAAAQASNTRSVSGPPTMPTGSAPMTPSITESSNDSSTTINVTSNSSVASSNSANQSKIHLTTPNRTRDSKDALSQLQNGDSLRRRASKRFSAYQYAKLANFTPERDPELPTKVNSLEPVADRSSNKNSPLLNGFTDKEHHSRMASAEPVDSIQVYLKIGQQVKKVALSGNLTTASLRLLFVEKFAYSPGSESFPDIYIQDPNSNVSYELENLNDIKDQTLISLHEAEGSNSVGWKTLEPKISSLTSQISQMQEALNSAVAEMQQIKTATPSSKAAEYKRLTPELSEGARNVDLKELGDIRRDLAVIRQVSSNNKTAFKDTINGLMDKVKRFKETSYDVSESSNRVYMESCRTKLSKECEGLLTKTDDLQDMIEATRKDVAQRRARPPKKQLIFISKELESSKLLLDEVNQYIVTEKQNWKKIWESELNTVCEEQQFFNLQEELVMDLQDDLAKAFETFELVEECSEQFSKNPNLKILPNLPVPGPSESLSDIRDALLSEVVALNPNHEGRVAAIERAERLREMQKEITLSDKFEEELGGFVEGKKLKKSGGIEETERLRELQNRENLGFLD